MSPPRSLPALTACFFLSGLAALVYQTAWTRELAFLFGTSELAVATVLAAYMAGLAAGAALAGRFVGTIRRPVLAYGWLELGIAASALAVPLGLEAATNVLLWLYGGEPGLPDASQGGIGLFYAATAFGLLMIPTLFMGATLPLLIRHAVGSDEELGDRVGRLYAWNTAGAVVGTLLTAFVLLPSLGLGRTVWVAVGVNVLVFLVAAWLARSVPFRATPSEPTAGGSGARSARVGSWVLPAIAVSGIVSFTGEVLWTRLLSHLLGGSVYAFASMLSAVLSGIALGSLLARRWANTAARATRAFAVAQLGAGLFSLAAFLAVGALPDFLPQAVDPWTRILQGAAVCIAILLPGALCFGATFPLAVRIEATSAEDAAAASARVYTWNTGGAIVGALSAAYLTLPVLGFEGTLALAVGLNATLAVRASMKTGERRRLGLAIGLGLGLVLSAVLAGPPERVILNDPLGGVVEGTLRELRVGRSATVTVSEMSGQFELRTNGLPESRIRTAAIPPGDLVLAHWMSVLPTVLRPGTDRMVVVGLGGGVSLEHVPKPIERLHVIELEPEVVAANRVMGAVRAVDPLADPRLTIHENDARSALLLTGDRFGAVVAQASHPWTAGSSHLYTREFFELVASRLEPGGVFVQWMGASFIDESLLRILVATLLDTWPHVHVYRPRGPSFLFVASDQPFAASSSVEAFYAQDPASARAVGLIRPADLEAALYLDGQQARAFAAGAETATDDRNLLQMRAPFVRSGPRTIASAGMPPTPDPQRPLSLAHVRSRLERGAVVEAQAAVGRLAGTERTIASAMVGVIAGRAGLTRRWLATALEQAPDHAEARALVLHDEALRPSGARVLELRAPLSANESIVRSALDARRAGDPGALADLDAGLAGIAWTDPLHRVALELRIAVRGEPERAREVIALVDEALPVYRSDASLLLHRARAASALGESETLLASLEAFLRPGARNKTNPRNLLEMRRLVGEADLEPEWSDRRDQLKKASARILPGRR